MNIFFSVLLILLYSNITFSQSENWPVFVNFLPPHLEIQPENRHCSPLNTISNIGECKIHSQTCNFKYTFEARAEVSNRIYITSDKSVGEGFFHLKGQSKTFSSMSKGTQILEFKNITRPSVITVYTKSYERQVIKVKPGTKFTVNKPTRKLTSHSIKLVPGNNKYEIFYPKNFKTIEFSLEGHKGVSIELVDQAIDYLDVNEKTQIEMGPGQYEFFFRTKEQDGIQKVHSRIVNVNENDLKDEKITILNSDLKEEMVRGTIYYEGRQECFSPASFEDIKSTAFTEIHSVHLNDSPNLKSQFVLKDSAVCIKPENKSSFQSLRSRYPSELNIKATCSTAELQKMETSYPLYLAPDSKSKIIGKAVLEILPENINQINSTFVDTNNVSTKFESNFIKAFCHPIDQFVFLYEAKSTNGEWSELGEGPWGKNAWINLHAFELPYVGYKFKYDGLSDATFVYESGSFMVKGDKYGPGNEFDQIEKKITPKDVKDEKGKFKGTMDCELHY
ncbi:hypothetical protein ACJVC5_02855 [Peredibacter sp. HCB2-198]|uniref:hypothetical protein n=1 Tax=Peredibacter sp. HCB2-198 TaxID=3383025 RepID=UPI0038B5404F